MVICFDPSVLLVNLLHHDIKKEGITLQDISKFCSNIKKELLPICPNDYVYFDTNDQAIHHALKFGPDNKHFIMMHDRIFNYQKANINHFNSKYPPEIRKAIEVAAQKTMLSLTPNSCTLSTIKNKI